MFQLYPPSLFHCLQPPPPFSVLWRYSAQVQAKEASSTNNDAADDIFVTSEDYGERSKGDTNPDENENGAIDLFCTDAVSDKQAAPVELQESLEGDIALTTPGKGFLSSAPCDGASSSTISRIKGKGSSDTGEEGSGEVITGGLAVAVSGHWRAAESQFEQTAQRVIKTTDEKVLICFA